MKLLEFHREHRIEPFCMLDLGTTPDDQHLAEPASFTDDSDYEPDDDEPEAVIRDLCGLLDAAYYAFTSVRHLAYLPTDLDLEVERLITEISSALAKFDNTEVTK